MAKQDVFKRHYLIAFFSTLVVSLGLLIGSFFAPPQGKIDGTVLAGVGESLLWPVLAFGVKSIEESREIKLRKEAAEEE